MNTENQPNSPEGPVQRLVLPEVQLSDGNAERKRPGTTSPTLEELDRMSETSKEMLRRLKCLYCAQGSGESYPLHRLAEMLSQWRQLGYPDPEVQPGVPLLASLEYFLTAYGESVRQNS